MPAVAVPQANYYRTLNGEALLHLGVSSGLVHVVVETESAADPITDLFHAMQLPGE
jgi:hypothetical protein